MLAILGYGSVIWDPGLEIEDATAERRVIESPFSTEFARLSRNRGNAPTLVPVSIRGPSTRAMLFLIKDTLSRNDVESILYRREIGCIGSGKRYVRPAVLRPNGVLVESVDVCEVTAIYTDFPDEGKRIDLTAKELAEFAKASVNGADKGCDGITYLLNAKAVGVRTRLMTAYESAILDLCNCTSLEEALSKCKVNA